MDRLIQRFDSERDSDLRLCIPRGVAYQKDMAIGRVAYDDAYLAKVDSYDGSAIARAVNAGRCDLVKAHLGGGASVLDVGAGSGAFVRDLTAHGFIVKGFDVIKPAAERLSAAGVYANDPYQFDAVTLWDCLEHMENPGACLRSVRKGAALFASIPVFEDLRRIRESKHYRPGEHLYYWTAAGFVAWMGLYGFRLLEVSAHETQAGRESIGAFAFRRDLPDYHDHIGAYAEMHATRYYGGSATELYLDVATRVVQAVRPASILDYGCGRSDLISHFWLDGKRRIARYDPAIPQFKLLPEGRFDLAFCCDLLEHVPMADVDIVLRQIRDRAPVALFTISTKLAKARLPDGRNAHVTLLTHAEWTRWVAEYFGPIQTLPSKWEHELVLLAGTQKALPPP